MDAVQLCTYVPSELRNHVAVKVFDQYRAAVKNYRAANFVKKIIKNFFMFFFLEHNLFN